MLMQLASLLEVDITGLAKERPFARMDANMIQDIAFSVEGLAAVRTNIRFLSSVSYIV